MATRQRKKKVTKADFIPAGGVPFDNGKVKMGIYYQKPKYVEQDPDMLHLQKWLIGDPTLLRREMIINMAYGVLLVFVLLVVICFIWFLFQHCTNGFKIKTIFVFKENHISTSSTIYTRTGWSCIV